MTFQSFLGLFAGTPTKRGLFHYVHCPAHAGDPKTKKLAIWEEAGWIKMRCWSGECSDQDIIKHLGLKNEDLRTDSTKHLAYTYCGADGSPIFRKSRSITGGKKTFSQQGYKNGHWVASKVHLNGQGESLYRLPEVLEAVKSGKTIYVNEGEKACEAIRAEGGVATCQPHGANIGSWKPHHSEILRGATIVVVADRDQTGERYAQSVYHALRGVAVKVSVVRSKTTSEKDDAFDHLAAGHSFEEFEPAPDLETGEDPVSQVFQFRDVDEILSMPAKPMLIKGLMGVRDRGMIFGPPASAKTALTVELMLALALGGVFAGQFEVERPCRVVYCTNEGVYGFPARLRAALSHNGEPAESIRGNLVTLFDMPQLFDEESERRLDHFASAWEKSGRGPLDLFVLDTLNKASLGGEESSNDDAARACDNLARIGERLNCGSLLLHHSPHDSDRPRGASAYIGDMDYILRSDYSKEQRSGTLFCFKGKDIEAFSPIGYKLVPSLDSIAVSWGFSGGDATFSKVALEMQTYISEQSDWTIPELSNRIGAKYDTVRMALDRELQKGLKSLIEREDRERGGAIYRLRTGPNKT